MKTTYKRCVQIKRRIKMEFEEVKKIIVDTLGCDEDKVTPESNIMEDLEADSLELHMAFEEALDIKIPDETLAKLQTVGGIAEYLREAADK